jgi:flagellar motility protein MotE (MotC chaperone)
MRYVRAAVLMSFASKLIVLGAWWWGAIAWTERPAIAAETKGAEKGAEKGGDKGPGSVAPDMLAESRGFRELLEAVQKRAADLDQRDQAMATRQATLRTLEKTVGDQVARLETLTKPAAGKGGADAPGAAAVGTPAGVTKIYESMKAEEAAPILDKMDDTTVKGILGTMKERQIGAILAAMNRDRAVAVTKVLAGGAPAPAPSVPTPVAPTPPAPATAAR